MTALALILVCSWPGPCRPVRITDVHRFPESTAVAFAYWQFACRHVEWLERSQPWETQWLDEARWCKRAWDLLDDCKRVYATDNPTMLTRQLGALREHIGWEAYYAGMMPPMVPHWFFRELR